MFLLTLLVIVLATAYVNSYAAATQNQSGNTRTYYIVALEEYWNYLPEETALLQQQRRYAEKYLIQQESPPRLGHIYKKGVFRECVDEACSQKKPQPPWLGVLGPLLKGKVGDTLEIHLLNNLSHPVSLHTHGVFYEKAHEGAFYQDSATDKRGSKILPGHNYTYYWQISPSRGPTTSDPECVLWAYHSHVFGDTDIHTGLIGPLIVCKSDSLSENSSLFREYVLLFLIFDENQSWYLDDNLSRIRNETSAENEELKEDESFQESNLMYSINGYMYNNLPALELCLRSEVTWHVMGMGNEADIHAVTFEGHPLTLQGHRTDVIHLLPGKFVTVNMKAAHEGQWPIKSQVGDHFHAGMEASFLVKNCTRNGLPEVIQSGKQTKTRKYYVAAEEVFWNYAPSGINRINNRTLLSDSDAAVFFERKTDRIGGTYKKVLYREYTDESFERPKPNPISLGILGPILRAEVGDILEIAFFNRASKPYTLHSTAFICLDCSSDRVKNETIPVPPGGNQTYRFLITDLLGPGSADSECIAWRYFSNVDSLKDTYSGLNGFLLICRPGSLTDDGMQKFVDKEYALMFGVMDENESHYIEDNIALFANESSALDREDPDFKESNLMHSINGFMYGNLMGLNLCRGDNTSWLLMAVGHEVDLHVAHFWGNAFLHRGNYRDTIELLPGSHFSVSMVPDALGTWLLECQTNDHTQGGMQVYYSVERCSGEITIPAESSGKVRNYFIAIVEEEWDYAPRNTHDITGEMLTGNSESKIFVTNDDTHIGSRYMKALFREYTDSSFEVRKPMKQEYIHLGLLGPFIKAEVGDIIRISLLNNGSNEYNIRPHGLVELGDDINDPVKPGMTKAYTWNVPPRSGPSSKGFNCTNWIYYSSVDSVKDTNSGLIGPLVICNPGILDDEGVRKDVDKEFGVLFTVMDENESWYLQKNIERYCHKPDDVDPEDEEFKESNLKHSINGRLYGSLDGLAGCVGDKVAWYLMGIGNEVDLHTAHFHGLTAVEKDDVHQNEGHREDVVDLSPGIFRTVEMTLDSRGKWMFHCHVDDHLKAGMTAHVTVSPC